MATLPAKATSVTLEGEPDGFEGALAYRGEVSPDGVTRLAISAPPDTLARVHRALIESLEGPLGVMYMQLTDRAAGKQHQDKPKRFLAVEIPKASVLSVFDGCRTLLYHDGRHQTWVRGKLREQLVLDELGMLYAYPDDFSFRDVLKELGVPEHGDAETMAGRDYVRVEFHATADPQETVMLSELRLQPFAG